MKESAPRRVKESAPTQKAVAGKTKRPAPEAQRLPRKAETPGTKAKAPASQTGAKRSDRWRGVDFGPKVVAVVLGLTLGGATIGAASNVAPSDRFAAESVVGIQHDSGPLPDDPALRRIRWEALAEIARLPEVLTRASRTARDAGSVEDVRRRTTVRGVPGGSVLRVRARGRSPATARALADAVASQAVVYVRDLNRRNFVGTGGPRRFSFEDGVDGWGIGEPEFSFEPRRVVRDVDEARVGSASLRADCDARPGCGPSVEVRGDYNAPAVYTARAFLRSPDDDVRVQLVLGSASKQVTAGPELALSDAWRQTAVRFTPKSTASSLQLSVQKLTPGAASIFVDDAILSKTDEANDQDVEAVARRTSVRIRAARAAAEDRYSVVEGTTLVDQAQPRTALWTLVGGLAGLLAALTGIAAATVARRRRHRSD